MLCGQIGTVFAAQDYVCPNAVGVDIGEGPFIPSVCALEKALRQHSESTLLADQKAHVSSLLKSIIAIQPVRCTFDQRSSC